MENAKMNSLIAQYPLVKDLVALKETTWFNPGTTSLAEGLPYVGLTEQDVQDAHARLSRFAPYLAKAFPETAATGGIIESELVAIPAMQKRLEKEYQQPISGQLLLKKDSHFACALPYQVPVSEGYYPLDQIQAELQEDGFDPIKFSIEMLSVFY